MFITTIAAGIIMMNGANAIFGPEPRATPSLVSSGEWQIGGLVVSYQSAAVIVVAAGLIVALHLLFTRTQIGRRLRAARIATWPPASDPRESDGGGDLRRRSALAGAAELLLSRNFFVRRPTAPTTCWPMSPSLGGWGSIPGAVVGALIIAAFEVAFPALPALIQRCAVSGRSRRSGPRSSSMC